MQMQREKVFAGDTKRRAGCFAVSPETRWLGWAICEVGQAGVWIGCVARHLPRRRSCKNLYRVTKLSKALQNLTFKFSIGLS